MNLQLLNNGPSRRRARCSVIGRSRLNAGLGAQLSTTCLVGPGITDGRPFRRSFAGLPGDSGTPTVSGEGRAGRTVFGRRAGYAWLSRRRRVISRSDSSPSHHRRRSKTTGGWRRGRKRQLGRPAGADTAISIARAFIATARIAPPISHEHAPSGRRNSRNHRASSAATMGKHLLTADRASPLAWVSL